MSDSVTYTGLLGAVGSVFALVLGVAGFSHKKQLVQDKKFTELKNEIDGVEHELRKTREEMLSGYIKHDTFREFMVDLKQGISMEIKASEGVIKSAMSAALRENSVKENERLQKVISSLAPHRGNIDA